MSAAYPLASTTWDDREREAIAAVVASGSFTMGERVAAFERAFAHFHGSRFAVMVNSGSSANLLAIAALCFTRHGALRPGDEVVVPAVSWATTYTPLAQYGLVLRVVDVDLRTLNLDLAQAADAISDRTRLVVTVNLLGNPNDFNRLREAIAGRDIILMEDNCEALGARFQNQWAGTFGRLGTFSCFFSHHISTMEGGLVVTDEEELYHLLLSLRAHGWTRQLPRENLVCGQLHDDPFLESFRFVLPGYNLRPLEMSGAIGLCQLEKLPKLLHIRRRNAALFQQLFAGHPRVEIQEETGESSWFGFSLLPRAGADMDRPRLRAALQAAAIECRPIVAGNICRHPVIAHLPHHVHGELRAANRIHDQGLFVGNHHYDLTQELSRLREVVDAVPAGRGAVESCAS